MSAAPAVFTDPPAPAPRSGRPASITPVFVRLKLSLLRNGLRQSRGRTVGWSIGVAFAMLYALGNGAAMIALRDNDYAPAAAITVAVVLGVGWTVMPLFFFGGDDTLDPTRLSMLPLRPRPLVTALIVSSLIGVGPLFTLLVATGTVIAVAHGVAAAVVAVLAVALTLLLCVALSRAVAAANTRLLTSRKGRDLAVLSGVFIAVGAQLINLGANSLSSDDGLHRASSTADVLRWIPPATAVDAVRSTGRGAYGLAAVQLAVTVLALGLVLRWWYLSLFKLMVSPDASTLQGEPERTAGASRTRSLSVLLPTRLVAGRTRPVMERQLRYMWRDPRAKASLVTGLAVGLLLPLVAVVQHGTVYQCLWAAGLLGMQMYNQFGMDGSSFWTVAATIGTRRDAGLELRGRALTLALIAVPYVTVVTAGAAVLLGRVEALPETLGLAFAFLGSLIATGAYASVRYPYAVPGDNNPFANGAPGQGGLVALNLFGGTASGAGLCLPVLVPVIVLHVTGHHGLLWLALPVGALYGIAMAAASLHFTAPRLLDRLPEILAVSSKG
ncbi:transporter [Streptomyces sp. CA-111067]|uniref:transporter n=1 Tax=Streptomyces sp. CA-111067 TaxID=3240046 RepID=UPI003D961F4D